MGSGGHLMPPSSSPRLARFSVIIATLLKKNCSYLPPRGPYRAGSETVCMSGRRSRETPPTAASHSPGEQRAARAISGRLSPGRTTSARDAQVLVGVGTRQHSALAAVTLAQAVAITRLASRIQLSETQGKSEIRQQQPCYLDGFIIKLGTRGWE